MIVQRFLRCHFTAVIFICSATMIDGVASVNKAWSDARPFIHRTRIPKGRVPVAWFIAVYDSWFVASVRTIINTGRILSCILVRKARIFVIGRVVEQNMGSDTWNFTAVVYGESLMMSAILHITVRLCHFSTRIYTGMHIFWSLQAYIRPLNMVHLLCTKVGLPVDGQRFIIMGIPSFRRVADLSALVVHSNFGK